MRSVKYNRRTPMNVSIIRRLAILVELQLVTDRRTNRQTGEHRAIASTLLAKRRALKLYVAYRFN